MGNISAQSQKRTKVVYIYPLQSRMFISTSNKAAFEKYMLANNKKEKDKFNSNIFRIVQNVSLFPQ